MTTPLHDYSSLGLPRITRTHTFQLRLLAACCYFCFLDFFDHTTQARYDGARGFSSTYFLALLLLLLFPWGNFFFHSFFFAWDKSAPPILFLWLRGRLLSLFHTKISEHFSQVQRTAL